MRPKKHLGQNFLKSRVIVERIAKSAGIAPVDTVLEIGPGKGILTDALLECGAKVIAVEKDSELIPFLTEKFKEETAGGRFTIIEGDILTLPIEKILQGTYKLVANIPYYITGEIIRKFLSSDHQPSSMTLLVQKEVARRIVAADKKESILSLSVKIFGTPTILEIVKRTMFTPAPSVDSAVINIANISKNKLWASGIEEMEFFKIIKQAFSQKRKQLLGNLKELKKEKELAELFNKKNIPLTVRAEDIPVELWTEIVKIIFKR